MSKSKQMLEIALSKKVAMRSFKVALVVGASLMIINHGDALMNGNIDNERLIKILLTFCVPYLVSTYSAVSATIEMSKK
ncbi:nitrate/nitrite transporter NrtS [Vibrio sp. TH_r3]|uniref:nitrate/nitrite transporter NrtS n=1 Tax=unclassified Vibrio TaxID=2614977 RepID=UPI0029552BD4|nr:nitrate/nitrite transporter NrtS [Vibrio sp. TH_r3]MDV7103350.1 nitrate/nitrite transporter NrtS [Vibrio sp. TH_r3]